MENKTKRPPSVWIAQTILGSLALACMAPLLMIVADGSPSPLRNLPVSLPVGGAIYTAVAIVLMFAFWGLSVRRPYGRWIAVAILAIVFFILLFISISLILFELSEPPNELPSLIAVIELVIFTLLMLVLVLRLAFGRRVSAFFDQRPTQDTFNDPPPPPPSFDA